MLLRFLAREIGARPAFWLLLIVTATPLLGVGTILMTIDPPLVFCWTWAMVAGWRAAQPDGQTRDWLVVGLAMGLGFLCKYTAVCKSFAGRSSSRSGRRRAAHLRKPGPWLALLIFSDLHPAGRHLELRSTVGPRLMTWAATPDCTANGIRRCVIFGIFCSREVGLLNPIFFIGAIWAMFGFWKFRRERPLWLYFFCMGAPVFLGHWLYSFHSRILPNWIALAVLPMFCLMVALLE